MLRLPFFREADRRSRPTRLIILFDPTGLTRPTDELPSLFIDSINPDASDSDFRIVTSPQFCNVYLFLCNIVLGGWPILSRRFLGFLYGLSELDPFSLQVSSSGRPRFDGRSSELGLLPS